jgi:hypothetical protein
MSTAHYRSAATNELVPEDDLTDIQVYAIKTAGIDYFNKRHVGSAYIEEQLIHDETVSVEVLAAFGRPVMVYKEGRLYGQSDDVSEMDEEEQEMWQSVVDTASSNE